MSEVLAKDISTMGVIEIDPSGNLLTNQVGGYACHHPEVRGFFRELKNDHIENFLMSYFCGNKYGGWCSRGIDFDTAYVIDAVIDALTIMYEGPAWPMLPWRTDMEMLNKSQDAWIYLKTDDGKRGVFTWKNSD